jgi:hypothetical protein
MEMNSTTGINPPLLVEDLYLETNDSYERDPSRTGPSDNSMSRASLWDESSDPERFQNNTQI